MTAFHRWSGRFPHFHSAFVFPSLIRVWDYPSKQFLCLGAGVPLNRKSASGYSLAVLADTLTARDKILPFFQNHGVAPAKNQLYRGQFHAKQRAQKHQSLFVTTFFWQSFNHTHKSALVLFCQRKTVFKACRDINIAFGCYEDSLKIVTFLPECGGLLQAHHK